MEMLALANLVSHVRGLEGAMGNSDYNPQCERIMEEIVKAHETQVWKADIHGHQ